MQTSAIRYRVTDFLKAHLPFSCMEEPDLLELVARGRVKFHESEEFLCWQDTAFAPLLFVIQQGSVSLWEDHGSGEVLRDIRGPGDVLGLERFVGATQWPYSARSNGDVVIYALPAADFEPLLRRYEPAARFVESQRAAGAVYHAGEAKRLPDRYAADAACGGAEAYCEASSAIAEAARRLLTSESDVLAVRREAEFVGTLSSREILAWAAAGCADCTVESIMRPTLHIAAPQAPLSECVLAMSRGGAAAVTANGAPDGALLGLVTPGSLLPFFGDQPLAILQALRDAGSEDGLRQAHLRARAFLLAQLQGPGDVEWLAGFAEAVNSAVIGRLLSLNGFGGTGWSWCFTGAAGRQELLTAAAPGLLVISPRSEECGEARLALHAIRAGMVACGYLAGDEEWPEEWLSASTAAWKGRFSGFIGSPIRSRMFRARPVFDLRLAAGAEAPWREVAESIEQTIRREPSFQLILAHDCLAALPPLTFFEDAVVDENGARTEVLEVDRRAIGPIVDVGRVYAAGAGRLAGTSTFDRLAEARAARPGQEAVFRHAAETLHVLLYLQARTGLRLGDDGSVLSPVHLSRVDRQALKSGFRSIHDLLAATIAEFWEQV